MHDHIDFVVSQWDNAMPDLDASSMRIFGRVLRLMKHLAKARSQALEPFSFKEGEFDVLATLRRAGAPYSRSPTQLYQALRVTTGAMTNRLDRLEQQHLIERVAAPDDKRSMLVGLTPHGQQQIEDALRVHTATQAAVLAPLDASERAELERLLKTLLLAFPGEAITTDERF